MGRGGGVEGWLSDPLIMRGLQYLADSRYAIWLLACLLVGFYIFLIGMAGSGGS